MQIHLSHSIEDQEIAENLYQRLTKVSSITKILTDHDFTSENDDFKTSDYYFWLISSKHLNPPTLSIFDGHSTLIGRRKAKFCIYIGSYSNSDVRDNETCYYLPLRNGELSYLESVDWSNREDALDELVKQILELLEADSKQKQEDRQKMFQEKVASYLKFFDLHALDLKEEVRYNGLAFYSREQKIIFVPILFKERDMRKALLHRNVKFYKNHKATFFFFPMDPFEKEDHQSLSKEQLEDAQYEFIEWVQKNNLGEKVHIVDTTLLVSKPTIVINSIDEKKENALILDKDKESLNSLTTLELEELLDLIDTDIQKAFDTMDALDWGNDKGTYNDKRDEWIDPPTGVSKGDIREQIKILLNKVFKEYGLVFSNLITRT